MAPEISQNGDKNHVLEGATQLTNHATIRDICGPVRFSGVKPSICKGPDYNRVQIHVSQAVPNWRFLKELF